MSWYDYIPVVGSVARLAQGDYKQAGIDSFGVIGPLAQKYQGTVDEQKNGMLTAAAQSRALGDRISNMSMEGLGRAENYYLPAKAMNRAAYGDPGALRK